VHELGSKIQAQLKKKTDLHFVLNISKKQNIWGWRNWTLVQQTWSWSNPDIAPDREKRERSSKLQWIIRTVLAVCIRKMFSMKSGHKEFVRFVSVFAQYQHNYKWPKRRQKCLTQKQAGKITAIELLYHCTSLCLTSTNTGESYTAILNSLHDYIKQKYRHKMSSSNGASCDFQSGPNPRRLLYNQIYEGHSAKKDHYDDDKSNSLLRKSSPFEVEQVWYVGSWMRQKTECQLSSLRSVHTLANNLSNRPCNIGEILKIIINIILEESRAGELGRQINRLLKRYINFRGCLLSKEMFR
jgi:hypothetical protein